MKIKQELNSNIYLFVCDMEIDDNLNFTIDTSEFDSFKLVLDENINHYTMSKTVDRTSHLLVEVEIPHHALTSAFEYEILTLLLK